MNLPSEHNDSLAQVLGLYDTPAYVRRGIQLAEARQRVFRRCETARAELLQGVLIHLKLLRQYVSDITELRDYAASEQDFQILRNLMSLLPANATVHALPFAAAKWGIGAQMRSLFQCVDRFNRRWTRFLADIDLSDIDAQVAAYNRYYLLEKECALGSPRLASRGFQPARTITRSELAQRYPLMACPE
jgi:hypothetical protein